jgi:uncharacterized Rmd1/YagE family protein
MFVNKKTQDALEWILIIIISFPLFIFIFIVMSTIRLMDFIEERVKK